MAPVIVLVGSGIVLVGVVWYAVYARSRVVGEGLLRDAIRPKPANPYRVVVPIANPETQRGLIRLAAASARANADAGEPELVAVNVVHVEHPSPLQNVEADRLDHQRDLLAAAREIAEEVGVRLRTRAVVAPDTGAALLNALDEEAAAEVVLGWSGEFDGTGPVLGPTIESVVESAPCDVVLVALREDVGTPVGLAGSDSQAVAVARRVAEFAAVDGTTPTLLTVRSTDGGEARVDAAAVTELVAAAGVDTDDFEVTAVSADALPETLARYGTVCVALDDGALVEVLRDVSGNVALVAGSDR
nr:universal stress protein [Salinigranum rubrum]